MALQIQLTATYDVEAVLDGPLDRRRGHSVGVGRPVNEAGGRLVARIPLGVVHGVLDPADAALVNLHVEPRDSRGGQVPLFRLGVLHVKFLSVEKTMHLLAFHSEK